MASMLRTAIMLSVLVGLPAAWIYYGPLPPGAQRMVNQCVAAAKEAVDWDKIDWSRLPKFELPWTKQAAKSAPPALAMTPMPRPVSTVAVSQFAAPPLQQAAPLATATANRGATPLHDQLEPLLARLRTLNAAEYALERWGAEGDLFRFRCEMPLADAGGVTQEFQATADSPRAAVEQVVGEVTAWQTARQSLVAAPRLASN